jgi:V/A-type H+-transporting ATPase subunit C
MLDAKKRPCPHQQSSACGFHPRPGIFCRAEPRMQTSWRARSLAGYVRIMIDSANLRSACAPCACTRTRTSCARRSSPAAAWARIAWCRRPSPARAGGAVRELTCWKAPQASAPPQTAGGTMTKLRAGLRQRRYRISHRGKMISFGEEPVIAYLAALEGEITALSMILTGRLAGIEPDVIRERLRDLNA